MSPQLPSYKCWKWECVRNASDVSSCNVNIWHPLCCVTGDKAFQMCTDVYVKIQHLFATFLLSFLLLWRDLRGFVGNIVLVFSRTFPLVLAAVWWHGSVSSACQGHTEMPENKSTDLTEMPVIQKENAFWFTHTSSGHSSIVFKIIGEVLSSFSSKIVYMYECGVNVKNSYC